MNKVGEVEDGFNAVEATTEESKCIKVIDKSTVHKICSGQVVLSLAVAVKELVENSVDAGATLVEVKLREQGLESIEVSDNGSGVEESNFEGMTAKYHTSKLREFTDLQGVETFGFRGEALSSLCALSDMVITTRHRTAEIGIKLELDHHGKIVKKSHCARQVGTTVALSNLFSTLPVRKREFTKNIKKEFTKMCQILQAYCLIAKGVRIICTNTTSKGAKITFLSTHGSHCVKDNIQSIFGSKQVADLIEMKPPINPDEKLSKELLTDLQDANSSLEINPEDIDKLNLSIFKIEGWISSCSHGSGRSSKDRQYFFVNSRPCEPKNISKIVNDMYHRYNAHQYPFVFLNVIVERSEVDVNMTPDKRQLLVNNEKVLLLAIKKSLLNTFGNIPSTFKMQNSFLDSVKQSDRDTTAADSDEDVIMKSDSKKFMAVLSQWKATGSTDEPAKPIKNCKRKPVDEISARNFKLKKIQEYLSQDVSGKDVRNKDESFVSCKSDSESDSEEQNTSSNSSLLPKVGEIVSDSREFDLLTQSVSLQTMNFNPQKISTIPLNNDNVENKTEEHFEETEHIITCKVKTSSNNVNIFEELESTQTSTTDQEQENIEKEIILDSSNDEIQTPAECKTEEINITIEEIKSLSLKEQECRNKAKDQSKIDRLKFKSEINPNQNKAAEEELQREINKDMFVKMDIIGQFNHGFIVVRLDNDLFIVDQHATDEKYNFENLQKTTVLQNQKLAIPQTLELTSINEMILIDNLKVFEANGFKFQIDEEAPVTKKVKLIAKPFSKNWEFGKDDIDELIFMLQDAPPETMCRPSSVRAMFASRACRKSVMIGKPLSRSIMRRLITHMGEIEQPWNCPHGRPTMRHLVNLAMMEDKE